MLEENLPICGGRCRGHCGSGSNGRRIYYTSRGNARSTITRRVSSRRRQLPALWSVNLAHKTTRRLCEVNGGKTPFSLVPSGFSDHPSVHELIPKSIPMRTVTHDVQMIYSRWAVEIVFVICVIIVEQTRGWMSVNYRPARRGSHVLGVTKIFMVHNM